MKRNDPPPLEWNDTVSAVRGCRLCADLPLGPAPLFQIHPDARILIASQAPGRLAHMRGRSFDDRSGDRLREWLGVDRDTFYQPRNFAILPMGLCYPGTGKNGDFSPRGVCAVQWRERLLQHLPRIGLTLAIGGHAMRWHLVGFDGNVTSAVRRWRDHWPDLLPLPHPSPRNNRWLAANPWFQTEVLPALRARIAHLLEPVSHSGFSGL